MAELIGVPEAARRLGVTRSWILRLCVQGRIPGAYKAGRDWLIPPGAKIEPLGSGRPLRTLEIPRAKLDEGDHVVFTVPPPGRASAATPRRPRRIAEGGAEPVFTTADEAVDEGVDEAVAPSNEGTMIKDAERILKECLKEGPVFVEEIKKMAKEQEIGMRTMHRAASRLGVVKRKPYGTTKYQWSMRETGKDDTKKSDVTLRYSTTMSTCQPNSVGLVLRALAFAAEKHRSQRRKDAEGSPYINHPIALADLLVNEAGIEDAEVIAAAILHDTVEDTQTSPAELAARFGPKISAIVAEVTDDKSLPKAERKRLQIEHAAEASPEAQLVKLADKICNLRDLDTMPPANWLLDRQREYFNWSKAVVDRIRDRHATLAHIFDEAYARRP